MFTDLIVEKNGLSRQIREKTVTPDWFLNDPHKPYFLLQLYPFFTKQKLPRKCVSVFFSTQSVSGIFPATTALYGENNTYSWSTGMFSEIVYNRVQVDRDEWC